MIFGALIAPFAGLIGTWLEGSVEEKKAKTAMRVAESTAKAAVMVEAATHESGWERIMAESSKSSWKDEYLTVILSIPLIMAFIPGMEDIVENGFFHLDAMPEWYQLALGAVVAANFSIRSATKIFKRKK
jgi:hypothetical protein